MLLLRSFLFFFVLFTLTTCSHRTATEGDGEGSLEGITGLENRKVEGVLANHAETFDKYVQGKLSESEITDLKQSCQRSPGENIFCHSINRSEILDKKIRARIKTP